jgi:hypothetical protein
MIPKARVAGQSWFTRLRRWVTRKGRIERLVRVELKVEHRAPPESDITKFLRRDVYRSPGTWLCKCGHKIRVHNHEERSEVVACGHRDCDCSISEAEFVLAEHIWDPFEPTVEERKLDEVDYAGVSMAAGYHEEMRKLAED